MNEDQLSAHLTCGANRHPWLTTKKNIINKHNNPLATIIMPALNAASTIENAIESILKQTFTNFELLIGDDGSTDGTASIVETIVDARIILMKNVVNQGAGATRDLLAAKAKGRWITFCDADDAWDPERLSLLISAAQNNNYAVIFDDIMECHSTKHGMVPWRRLRGPGAFGSKREPLHIDAARLIDSKRMLIMPLFSRALLHKSGARHSTHAYGEDSFFLLKLLTCADDLIYIPAALYMYRISPGSASKNAQRHELLSEILQSCLPDFKAKPRVQAALRRKIHRVSKDATLVPFTLAIKERRITDALHLLSKRPSLAVDFARRALSDLPYHLHRLYHGGATRGSK
jgi:succinoglycan biosynthesis protein ExoO